MKKILTLLITSLMIFVLVGCNSKENEPIIEEEPEIQEEVESKEDELIVGGYIEAEDQTITKELEDIFDNALEGLMGASYTPIKLIATQVVNGTNYKFLAEGTKTTNPITKGTYYITIYKDLQGNIELKDIEVIEEKQEETKDVFDPSIYDYYVVFYDQYGNELQREILHYGEVPSYKGYLPEGFDNWTYKKTRKDVDTFKPIITNTYFEAKCHYVYHEPAVEMPNKGELLKVYVGSGVAGADIDGNMIFRVLSKNGNIYKLLGFNSIELYEFESQAMIDFGGINGMTYDGGHIDTKLSDWYTTLDVNVKSAIKSTRLKQHLIELFEEYAQGMTPLSGQNYKFDKYVELTNDRYVFAPDVEDLVDYLDGTLTAEGVRNMLSINGDTSKIWSRSAGYDHINPCENYVAIGMSGYLCSELSLNPIGGDPLANIVPCFYIDLTADGIIYETYTEN